MKRYMAILLIGLLASCSGFQDPAKKYGIDFNQKRIELGLPVLQADWKLVKSTEDVLKWDPDKTMERMAFISKTLTVKNGKLYAEENRFEGKHFYHNDGDDLLEEVYISCYFDDKEQISQWNCIYKGSPKGRRDSTYSGDTRITIKQADSILTSWRIKY